jgi:outer membrane beta-barrel protein
MKTLVGAGVALTVLLGSGAGMAQAQEERVSPVESQPPVRHRHEVRSGRVFVGPYTGALLTSDYKNTYLIGAQGEYYLNDWLSIGGAGAAGLNQNTTLTNELLTVLPCETNPGDVAGCNQSLMIKDMTTGNLIFNPKFDRATPLTSDFLAHLNQIGWVADLHAGYTPLFGKIAVFGGLFSEFDLELEAGVGFVNFTNGFKGAGCDPKSGTCTPITENPDNAGTRIGLNLGAEMHFFFNDWGAINLGFKDYIVNDNPGGFDINHDRGVGDDDLTLQNKIFATLGVIFYLPPSVEVSP